MVMKLNVCFDHPLTHTHTHTHTHAHTHTHTSLTPFPFSLGLEAFLEYSTVSEDGRVVMDLTHTEVPEEFRGEGIGGVLAHTALEYALMNRVNVRLTCGYLKHYVSKHSEYQYIVVQ